MKFILWLSLIVAFTFGSDNNQAAFVRDTGLALTKGYEFGACLYSETFNILSKTTHKKTKADYDKAKETASNTCENKLKVKQWLNQHTAKKHFELMESGVKLGTTEGYNNAIETQQTFWDTMKAAFNR